MNPQQLTALGICWYTPESYERVKAVSDDAETFFDAFDDWLASAQRKLLSDELRGANVIRVNVDAAELVAFCRAQNTNVDAHCRSLFASHKAYEVEQLKKRPR